MGAPPPSPRDIIPIVPDVVQVLSLAVECDAGTLLSDETFCKAFQVRAVSATHCSTAQHTAAQRSTLQHSATHCSTAQRSTAAQRNSLFMGATLGSHEQAHWLRSLMAQIAHARWLFLCTSMNSCTLAVPVHLYACVVVVVTHMRYCVQAAFMLGDPVTKPKEYGEIMGYYSRQVCV